MLAFGSQIMSCVADIANTALRLIKSSSLASHAHPDFKSISLASNTTLTSVSYRPLLGLCCSWQVVQDSWPCLSRSYSERHIEAST